MANENLSTIKAKIAAADGIRLDGPNTTTVTNKETALQTAIAAKEAALVERDEAVANRDQAVALKNQAMAQRDNAIAALGDTTYYAALEAKDARINALLDRLTATTFEVINASLAALAAYEAKDIRKATVADIPDKVVTGEAITPTPAVTLGGETLTKDTDYTLSYDDNTEVGTATVTVTGIGEYFFSKTVTFEIVEQAVQPSDDNDGQE